MSEVTRAEAVRTALRSLDADPAGAADLLAELAPLTYATVGSRVWTEAEQSVEVLGGCGCTEVRLEEDPYRRQLAVAAREAVQVVGTGEVRDLAGRATPVMVVRGAGHRPGLLFEVAQHEAAARPEWASDDDDDDDRLRTGFYTLLPEGTQPVADDVDVWTAAVAYRPQLDGEEQLTLFRLTA